MFQFVLPIIPGLHVSMTWSKSTLNWKLCWLLEDGILEQPRWPPCWPHQQIERSSLTPQLPSWGKETSMVLILTTSTQAVVEVLLKTSIGSLFLCRYNHCSEIIPDMETSINYNPYRINPFQTCFRNWGQLLKPKPKKLAFQGFCWQLQWEQENQQWMPDMKLILSASMDFILIQKNYLVKINKTPV